MTFCREAARIALLLVSAVNLVRSEQCDWMNQTSSYNELCARQAARYSSVAYNANLKSIYEWQCTSCKQSPELYILDILDGRRGDYYGYIGYQISRPEVLVLSFRGTIWLDGDTAVADLSFSEISWPKNVFSSAVHHGFLQYYLKVQDRVRNIVTDRLSKFPETKLVITGHSLGGAAAIIALVDLYDITQDSIIYTFGSPRVGNSFFAQYMKDLNVKVFRVNHDHDIVPHLPPCTLSLWDRSCKGGTYPTHVPKEILYDAQMESYIQCSNGDGEDSTCSNSFPAISYSITEHLFYFGYDLSNPDTFILHTALDNITITI